jgi:hypothetical protein
MRPRINPNPADNRRLPQISPIVSPDDSTLHVWVEGEGPGTPNVSVRRVRISADHTDLGLIRLPATPHGQLPHDSEYGQKYDDREPGIY